MDVDYDALGTYGDREPEHVHVDLLLVAGTVALADRCFRRTTGTTGWARSITVQMPVREPSRWHAASDALRDCLDYVTGDRWTFEFTAAAGAPIQRVIGLHREADVVVPFSGGLDSFLLRSDLVAEGTRPLVVTALTTAAIGRAAHRAAGTSTECARIPIRLAPGTHAESTFRTRTFLFGCVSSVASFISGTHKVLVAENGQGAIGAGLVPFGSESPYRTTHPVFTDKLVSFLRKLGMDVTIEHPYLWRTKGSVLKDLVERGVATGWQGTVSCSRDMRRTKQVPDDRACGICGNCLLRRLSVHAAGLVDSTAYHWSLGGPRLRDAVAPGGTGDTTQTDLAIAVRSVAVMDAFATMTPDAPALRRNAFAVAESRNLPLQQVAESQRTLHAAHAAEWRDFVRRLPSNSWVLSYLGAHDVIARELRRDRPWGAPAPRALGGR